MKKLLCAILAVTMLLSLCACKTKGNEGAAPSVEATGNQEKPGDTMTLEEIVKKIEDGVELPEVSLNELTEEMFEYVAFTSYYEGLEGVVSEAMINVVPHSLVVLRAPDEERAEALAKDVDANKDPRKWICVEAEKSQVVRHGRTVLLVMSDTVTADAIIANFDALWS